MEMSRQNAALTQEKRELVKEIEAKNALTVKLQKKISEKNAEIGALKAMKNHLSQEVIRSKTKVLTPKNKAEAVSLLAGVETDIAEVREQAPADSRQAFETADQLIAQARTELGQGNYTEASALAGKAMEIIQPIQLNWVARNRKKAGAPSHFPLAVRILKKSHIRKLPGIKAETVCILNPEAVVTATGRQGRWIRIILTDRKQTGWIHQTLVAEVQK